jgi:hypothetical protein
MMRPRRATAAQRARTQRAINEMVAIGVIEVARYVDGVPSYALSANYKPKPDYLDATVIKGIIDVHSRMTKSAKV